MYHDYLAGAENIWIWVAIALIVLLLFGGSKIPEMMKGLGMGVRELKKGMRDDDTGDDELNREKEREARIRAEINEERDAEVRARIKEEMRREEEARRQKGLS